MLECVADVRACALRALARREHSCNELKTKLLEKGGALPDIESVLTVLQQQSLLCDKRFTENYVLMRVKRGFGPSHIEHALRLRGVAEVLINTELAAYQSRWPALAKKAWQKKFAQVGADYQSCARQARFLQQRGFASEQIAFVFEGNKREVS